MLNPVLFIVAVLTDFLTFLSIKREEPQVRSGRSGSEGQGGIGYEIRNFSKIISKKAIIKNYIKVKF